MDLEKLRKRVENTPGIADLMARQALNLPWKFAVAYDFNLPEEVEEYGELIKRCRGAFGANVRWRVEASRNRAIFELAHDRDAVEFVLMCDRPTEVLPRTIFPRRATRCSGPPEGPFANADGPLCSQNGSDNWRARGGF